VNETKAQDSVRVSREPNEHANGGGGERWGLVGRPEHWICHVRFMLVFASVDVL
jgi:hypothetical protein